MIKQKLQAKQMFRQVFESPASPLGNPLESSNAVSQIAASIPQVQINRSISPSEKVIEKSKTEIQQVGLLKTRAFSYDMQVRNEISHSKSQLNHSITLEQIVLEQKSSFIKSAASSFREIISRKSRKSRSANLSSDSLTVKLVSQTSEKSQTPSQFIIKSVSSSFQNEEKFSEKLEKISSILTDKRKSSKHSTPRSSAKSILDHSKSSNKDRSLKFQNDAKDLTQSLPELQYLQGFSSQKTYQPSQNQEDVFSNFGISMPLSEKAQRRRNLSEEGGEAPYERSRGSDNSGFQLCPDTPTENSQEQLPPDQPRQNQ